MEEEQFPEEATYYDSKEKARETGQRLAQINCAQLLVHRDDGSIEERVSFITTGI